MVELWVPELRKLPPGQQAVVFGSAPGYIGLDTYDVPHQHVVSHHFRFDEGLPVGTRATMDVDSVEEKVVVDRRCVAGRHR